MGEGFELGLLVTMYGYGLRHGIDWDHIAAITDIAASQDSRKRSMLFATLYAVGHACVVLVLGVLAIAFSSYVPESVDRAMGRVVGVTLLALGLYVLYGLARHGSEFRVRSRWMLVFTGVRRLVRRLRPAPTDLVVVEHEHAHEHAVAVPHHVEVEHVVALPAGAPASPPSGTSHSHRHRHAAPMPDDPFGEYGRRTSFLVGLLHGVGAETPTQVLVLVAAAGVGGRGAGVLLLVAFLAGLVTSNTGLALASTFGLLGGDRHRRAYLVLSVVIAAFSLALGALLVLDRGDLLPGILA